MSMQIKKKFILADSIDGEKLLFLNNQTMRSRNAADTADVDLMKLDGSDKLQFLVVPQVSSDPVSAEDLARKGYVDTEVSDLQGQIDALSLSGGAAVAAVQSELDATQVGAGLGTDGSYTVPVGSNYLGSATSLKDADSKLDTQIKAVADDLAQEIIDRAADVDAEESRAMAAEGQIASDLAQEILDRAADVDAEESRAMAAEGQIASDLAQEILDRIADVDAEESRAMAAESVIAGDLAQEILDRTADVDAEESRAMAAESLLDGRLDIVEGDATTVGSIAKAQADAQAYADQKIADLVAGAPALLDTLNELAAAINDDENFAVTVTNSIAAVQTAVDNEETRAMAAESALDLRVDALEAASVQFVQQKFTLSAGDITNGYITLSNLAITASINAFVDRLAIHETDDYTVSTVGGVSRITFVGSLVTNGQEKLSAGDVVRVKYAKVAIV